MSMATMEEEIVDVSVRLNQAMRMISKTSSYIAVSFQSYFKTGISKGKILFLARSM